MKHRQIRRELASDIRRLVRARNFPIVFRNYQRETLQKTASWLETPKGSNRAYVNHATGTGKTVLFASIAASAKNLRCLVIVPNKLLVVQTAREIVKLTNHAVGHVSTLGKIHDTDGELVAMRGHKGQRIVVTTDASFKLRAKQFADDFAPHVIVRDECHWSYTEKTQDAFDLFPEAVFIGYSATPDYLTTTAKSHYVPVTLDNGQVLYAPPERLARTYYPTMLDRRTIRWGIEHAYLAPLAWGFIELELSLDQIPVQETPSGMDYDPEALAALMAKHWPLLEEMICRLYESNAYGIRERRVCAMCPSVAQAESLAKKIAKYVPSACVSGTTHDEDRDMILTSFDLDESTPESIKFISSVFVLREGWNARNAEVALMLRPTRSRVMYEQFLGRILRLRRDGRLKAALVIDALFQGTRLAPLNAPALYGTPGESVSDGGWLIHPPKRRRSATRFDVSPYLMKHARPKLRVVDAVQIDLWAGDDGMLSVDGEWWGALKILASRLGISPQSIQSRITGCRSRKAKNLMGHLATYYALSDVERANADVLKLQKANPDGFFEANGEWWGTVEAFTRRFKLSAGPIISRIVHSRTRKGRDAHGGLATFYALSDVEKACADLLKKVPKANVEGFFEADGERWGTIKAITRVFRLGEETIRSRLRKRTRTKVGKDQKGHLATFYALSDVEKACADLLKKVPKANVEGFFEADGEWGTLNALRIRLGLSPKAVRLRLAGCRMRKAKDAGGHVVAFFALEDVKKACSDLLNSPNANTEGLFEADGERWGSLIGVSRRLNLPCNTIRPLIDHCRTMKGRDVRGRLVTFYALLDVEKACADLFAKKRGKRQKKAAKKKPPKKK